MVKAIANIRSKNDTTGKTIFYRVRTDKDGFNGKIKVTVGPASLPDQNANISGEDSVLFSAKHTQSGTKVVVTVSANSVSSSVRLNLDAPSDPPT
jgi:hypothetical protein